MHLEYSLHPLAFYTTHPLRHEFFMGINKVGTLVYFVPKEHEEDFQDSIKQTIMDNLSEEERTTVEFYYEHLIYSDFKRDEPANRDEILERIETFISNNLI